MKAHLKKFFIPHAENDYHPQILHPKRAWFYGLLAVAIKGVVAGVVMLLPAQVFVMPDILAVEQSKIVIFTNALRAKEGLPKLVESPKLAVSAETKAVDMATKEYFSHESPEGRRLTYFLDQAGYKYESAGENLAIGYFDAEEVVSAWKASPLHKANMLDNRFKEIGLSMQSGQYDGAPTVFIAEHFGQPLAGEENPALADAKTAAEKVGFQVLPGKIIEMKPLMNFAASGPVESTIPFEKRYVLAGSVLNVAAPVFNFSKMVYLILIIFFTCALLLNIFVEIKIQHKHVIVRTLGLLGVLVGLWLI